MKRKNNTVFLTRGAIISALYVILTYLSYAFGLSSGAIQFRLSDMLCILPFFFPEAVLALFIGCILSNLITNAAVLDIVFGSFATLIGAAGAWLFGALAKKSTGLCFLIPLPTVLSNTLIIPLVLRFTYGAEAALPFLALSVGIGEILTAWIFGLILFFALKKVFENKTAN